MPRLKLRKYSRYGKRVFFSHSDITILNYAMARALESAKKYDKSKYLEKEFVKLINKIQRQIHG